MHEAAHLWTDFFVASAGAAAALAGLLFVALSVNLERILRFPHLPAYAAASTATLILILLVSIAALIPQGMGTLGEETFVFAMGGWALQILSAYREITTRRQSLRPPGEIALHIITGQMQVLPMMVGAIFLTSGRENGLYWIAGGILAIFIFATLNAWVLLVEILR
jgi:hypothetical protein